MGCQLGNGKERFILEIGKFVVAAIKTEIGIEMR